MQTESIKEKAYHILDNLPDKATTESPDVQNKSLFIPFPAVKYRNMKPNLNTKQCLGGFYYDDCCESF